MQANSDASPPYVTKYYQGRHTLEDASLVANLAGEDKEGIDFVLEKTKAISVTNQGGSLQYTEPGGGQTVVDVPAGAVSETITLVYAPIEQVNAPSGFALGGYAFELTAHNASGALAHFVFQKPVLVGITYDDADVAILDEATLVLEYRDEGSKAWVDAASTCDPASNYTRQPGQNKLSVEIYHLSTFALFGETEQTFVPVLQR